MGLNWVVTKVESLLGVNSLMCVSPVLQSSDPPQFLLCFGGPLLVIGGIKAMEFMIKQRLRF